MRRAMASTPGSWPARWGAGLFAVHPLRVEPVAWATERRDVPCGLFSLLAVLALLSESTAVSLPGVLLVLGVYPVGRLGAGLGAWLGARARRVSAEQAPFLVLSGAASALVLLPTQVEVSVTFDHEPPHFHAEHQGQHGKFDMRGEIVIGSIQSPDGSPPDPGMGSPA